MPNYQKNKKRFKKKNNQKNKNNNELKKKENLSYSSSSAPPTSNIITLVENHDDGTIDHTQTPITAEIVGHEPVIIDIGCSSNSLLKKLGPAVTDVGAEFHQECLNCICSNGNSKSNVDNRDGGTIDASDKNIGSDLTQNSKDSNRNFSNISDICVIRGPRRNFSSNLCESSKFNSDKTGSKSSKITSKGEQEPLEVTNVNSENVINPETNSTESEELSSSSFISIESSSSVETLRPSETDLSTDPKETKKMEIGCDCDDCNGTSSSIEKNHCNEINDDNIAIHVDNNSNSSKCDNKSLKNEQIQSDRSEYSNGIDPKESCDIQKENLIQHNIKFEIFKDILEITYPCRVESPKTLRSSKSSTNEWSIKKSHSLDDNKVFIQEVSDHSSNSDLNDNPPIISEAESEQDSDVAEKVNDKLAILSVYTFPLDPYTHEIQEVSQIENISQMKTVLCESQDLTSRRANKRSTTESHFFQQFLNSKFLDSIKEEGSDISDVDRKSDCGDQSLQKKQGRSKSMSDIENEKDGGSRSESKVKRSNAIFPKSNLNFSEKKKHLSALRAPATDVIREESPCYIIEAKVIEHKASDQNKKCLFWKTETVPQSDAAEIIFLDSASSGSSDFECNTADDADIEDLIDDCDDVRISTPNIDAYNQVGEEKNKSVFRSKSKTPTPDECRRHKEKISSENELNKINESQSQNISREHIYNDDLNIEKCSKENLAKNRKSSCICFSNKNSSEQKNSEREQVSDKNYSNKFLISEKNEYSSEAKQIAEQLVEEIICECEKKINHWKEKSSKFKFEQFNMITTDLDSVESDIILNKNETLVDKFLGKEFQNNMETSNNNKTIKKELNFSKLNKTLVNPQKLVPFHQENQILSLSEMLEKSSNEKENISPPVNTETSNTSNIEFHRQDSSSSHCSEHSQSTVINYGSSKLHEFPDSSDLDDHHKTFSKLRKTISSLPSIQSLRQLCIQKLSSMPYGVEILEELASVAETLNSLTKQKNISKVRTDKEIEKIPYFLSDLPEIEEFKIPIRHQEMKAVRFSLVQPPLQKLRSPPPPPIPEPPKRSAWIGLPTHEDPKVLVCLSPSQQNYLKKTGNNVGKDTSPDNLLDMHKKFVERRGYHEPSLKKIEKINREKSKYFEKIVESSAQLKSGPSSTFSTTLSLTPPPIPPPPSSPLLKSLSDKESTGENVAKLKDTDKNNHRLLAIIRDSSTTTRASENFSKNDIDENNFVKVQVISDDQSKFNSIKTKNNINQKCNRETQTRSAVSAGNVNKENIILDLDKSKEMPFNIAGEEYFRLHNEDIFSTDQRRFSNIESTPKFCSQILKSDQKKRFSNIETSSHEYNKRIENDKIIYEHCHSNKQKYEENENHLNTKKVQDGKSESEHEPKKSRDHNINETIFTDNHIFKNRKDTNDKKAFEEISTFNQNFSYNEFRHRAKDSAKKAQNEFFHRENLFEKFDDINQYFGDYFQEVKNKEEQKKHEKLNKEQKIYNISDQIKSNDFPREGESHKRKEKHENVFNMPTEFEKKFEKSSSSNISKKTNSEFNIPVIIESDSRKFRTDELQEKRLSSQNLDKWLRYTSENLGSSSENITKPFKKEVDIVCRGRPANIRAPRLSASTTNLLSPSSTSSSTQKHIYNRSFSKSQSTIDQTPITCYVNPCYPKRSSLPRELHDRQADYIKMKEQELQIEYEKLETERIRLIEELNQMRTQSMHNLSTLKKDASHHRSCRLPTLSEDEVFRQQMHDEWLDKIAEREERRLQKIIKISKPSDNISSDAELNKLYPQKLSSSTDIRDEFLQRVRERRTKLCMPSDSEWESGAESYPTEKRSSDIDEPNVKVIEGQHETDLKKLPKHLREFAQEFTSQIHQEKIFSKKMPYRKDGGEFCVSQNILRMFFVIAVLFSWTVWRFYTN